MIREQDDDYSVIDNIYLYVNDPIEENIYISLKKREKIGLEECEKKFRLLLNTQMIWECL